MGSTFDVSDNGDRGRAVALGGGVVERARGLAWLEAGGDAPGEETGGDVLPVANGNAVRVCPFVSSGAALASTSFSNDCRKLGPPTRTATGECDNNGPAAELRLVLLDSAGTSDDDPASSSFLLVLGLFNGRSGWGVGSASEGDAVADFRFLLFESEFGFEFGFGFGFGFV